MSVHIKYGIGFSSETGTQYIDMAAAKKYEPQKEFVSTIPINKFPAMPWSQWGTNNLMPLEMLAHINNCGQLTGIIEGRARLAVCEGIQPVIKKASGSQMVIDRYVDDAEITEFLDMNDHFWNTFAFTKDYIGFQRMVARIMLNKNRTAIAAFQRDDVTEHRVEKKDKKGKINNVYYCAEWMFAKGATDPNIIVKPLLDIHNPVRDLRQRVDGGDKNFEYSIIASHPGWNCQYYTRANWMAALKWVSIAEAVPEMKDAIFNNGLRVKQVCIIQETFWPKAFGAATWKAYTEKEKEDARQKIYDEIDKTLTGAKNANKTIFTTGYRDRDGKTWADISFQPIEDSTKIGEYLPDSAAANSEIAFAMLWNNAMTGGNQSTGLYSENQGGSNVREASALQVIIHQIEREMVRKFYNTIKYFNGWNKTYPGLDFIIPATILTTLDTGAGSKPVVPGQTKTNDNGANQNNP
jgi:hypothetical protein